MIDLDRFTRENWDRIRYSSYRMTGNILDAEDLAQEIMLRAVEMGSALGEVPDHAEWIQITSAETALALLRGRKSLPLDEFDLPDSIQTEGPGAAKGTLSPAGDTSQTGVLLQFLFPLQYMTPEQRVTLVLRDGNEDGDRIAATALGMTFPEIYEIVDKAKVRYLEVRKRWGENIPFTFFEEEEGADKVFRRFIEILQFRDRALLQQLLWDRAELLAQSERRSGQDFVTVACVELLERGGAEARFTPLWLNGCRGLLCWRRSGADWERWAVLLVICNGKGVRTLKWSLDAHLLRGIEAEEPAEGESGPPAESSARRPGGIS